MSISKSRLYLPLTTLTFSALLAAGCDTAATTPAAMGKGYASALAILNTDYQTATVSLYDPHTKTLVDDCVGVADLSKDVALPTGTQHGDLVIIDREHSVIDFFDPTQCTMRTQLSVSTGGLKADPHDVVSVSATKAYVLRYEKNAAATADPGDFDDGDDLLIIDPSMPKVLGRIDLSSHATTVAGAVIQARPDRGLLADGKVYVTLNNLSAKFDAAGPGRVAIIDPATDTVTGVIDLPDQTGCSGLAYVATTKQLYVSCGGEFSDADQTAKSALVTVDLSGATPVLGKIVTGKSLGTQPLSYAEAAILGTNAYVGTSGALDFTTNAMLAPDTVYAVTLDAGTPTKVVDGGAFTLGRPALDAASKTLFLPDGSSSAPLIRVFDVSGAAVVAGTSFEPNPTDHLPPREVMAY